MSTAAESLEVGVSSWAVEAFSPAPAATEVVDMSSDCSDGNPPPTLFSEVAVLGSETDSVADDAPASGAVVASVTEGISIANTKHRATVANSAEPLSRLRWRRSHGWYLRPFCRVLNFPVPISHSAPPPRAIERNVFGLQERKRRTTRPHGSNTPWDCLRLFSYPTNVPNCQDFIRNLFKQVYLHRYRYEIPLFSG